MLNAPLERGTKGGPAWMGGETMLKQEIDELKSRLDTLTEEEQGQLDTLLRREWRAFHSRYQPDFEQFKKNRLAPKLGPVQRFLKARYKR